MYTNWMNGYFDENIPIWIDLDELDRIYDEEDLIDD